MCHQFIKHEKSFRCLRLPVLVEEVPEIVTRFRYKNVYCSCAYFSLDTGSKALNTTETVKGLATPKTIVFFF